MNPTQWVVIHALQEGPCTAAEMRRWYLPRMSRTHVSHVMLDLYRAGVLNRDANKVYSLGETAYGLFLLRDGGWDIT